MKDDGAAFFDVITTDFREVNVPKDGLCADGIKLAFQYLDALKNDTAAWATSKADYNLCENLNSS